MIMLLILIIVALVAAGFAVKYLGAEAGYVLLSFNGHTVEMTLWTLIGLTVLALLLLVPGKSNATPNPFSQAWLGTSVTGSPMLQQYH